MRRLLLALSALIFLSACATRPRPARGRYGFMHNPSEHRMRSHEDPVAEALAAILSLASPANHVSGSWNDYRDEYKGEW